MNEYTYWRSIFRFSNRDGQIHVSGYKGSEPVIDIPATINSVNVARAKPIDFWPCGTIIQQDSIPHSETAEIKLAEIGTIIQFGEYVDAFGSIIPLTWVVVDVTDDRMLLLSEKSIEVTLYSPSKNPGAYRCKADDLDTWAGSYLRVWLNGPFFGLSFSKMERELIQGISNVDLFTQEITNDKVFILDENEARKYYELPQVDKRITRYLILRRIDRHHLGCEICDWVRSWHVYSDGVGQGVWFGDRLGTRDQYMPFYSVRPAVWIKAEDNHDD